VTSPHAITRDLDYSRAPLVGSRTHGLPCLAATPCMQLAGGELRPEGGQPVRRRGGVVAAVLRHQDGEESTRRELDVFIPAAKQEKGIPIVSKRFC
jgi:hypothetical protein